MIQQLSDENLQYLFTFLNFDFIFRNMVLVCSNFNNICKKSQFLDMILHSSFKTNYSLSKKFHLVKYLESMLFTRGKMCLQLKHILFDIISSLDLNEKRVFIISNKTKLSSRTKKRISGKPYKNY